MSGDLLRVGAFFDLGDLAPASARAEPPEDGRPEDDNDEPSDAGLHPSSEGGGGLFGLFGGGEAAPPPPVVVTKRIATAAPKDTADFSLTVSLTRTIPSDSALPVEKWGHPQKLMRQGLLDGLAMQPPFDLVLPRLHSAAEEANALRVAPPYPHWCAPCGTPTLPLTHITCPHRVLCWRWQARARGVAARARGRPQFP